jgi:peptidoglycan-associated lipoprotein
MTTSSRITLSLAAVLLVAGAVACHKPAATPEAARPAAAPEPAKPEAAKTTAASDDQAGKAQDAAEAGRLAAAAEMRKAAEAALKDVHFDYDKSDIKDGDKPVLMGVADFLKKYPQVNLTVEGNCDERGTVEYNLALGERRAAAVRDYLVGLGVPSTRLAAISYGKEKPLCTETGEVCWSLNRRDHFSM